MTAFKPYPAYRDAGVEWLGEVSEHWEVRRLRYMIDGKPAYGATPRGQYVIVQGFPRDAGVAPPESNPRRHKMTAPNLSWIANYIWGIADDVLRDVYVRGKYRDVILPMTVLRRLDAVLEPTKRAVLEMKATLDAAGVANQDAALRQAAGQAFHNTSQVHAPRPPGAGWAAATPGRLRWTIWTGSLPTCRTSSTTSSSATRSRASTGPTRLGSLIEKLTSPDINLGPDPVMETDGTVRHPGLDNHGMGTVFEELIRRFNEENNEEAGEHFTPRDAVTLMATARVPAHRRPDRVGAPTCSTTGHAGPAAC